MQILCLHLLFCQDLLSIQHSQLWNMEQRLSSIVLLVLNWIEAEVEVSEECQLLDELQLQNLLNLVE